MTKLRVADLTIDEFRDLIRETVRESIGELLADPNGGLELREEMRAQLERSLDSTQSDEETKSAQEVAARLGLDW